MERSYRIAALVTLASSIVASQARADFERHCEDRPLDGAEQTAAARVVSAFRAALPGAPAGWTVLKNSEQVSGIACAAAGTTWVPGGKLVPQPISINVHRTYLRTEAPPRAAAEAAPAVAKPTAKAGGDPARRKDLEAKLAELQQSRQDAVREYQKARQAGDRAGQDAARRRDREIALAIRPVQEELSRLRKAESGARAAELEEHTAAARAQQRAAEERRTDASVSITANLAWLQLHGEAAEPLDSPGADAAIRKSGGVVLLLGPWRFGRGDTAAGATIDAAAPPSRVQSIAVEISGNRATTESLRAQVGVAGLRTLIGR